VGNNPYKRSIVQYNYTKQLCTFVWNILGMYIHICAIVLTGRTSCTTIYLVLMFFKHVVQAQFRVILVTVQMLVLSRFVGFLVSFLKE
jgi:hypothetical protein